LNNIGGKKPTERLFSTTIAAGTCTGVVGALLGNPLFLVKARMQAFSPSLPVGTQRYYRSSIDAVRSIYVTDGFNGLFRGARAAMVRTSLGTSVQMPTYFFTKGQLIKNGMLREDNPLAVVLSSAAAGAMVVRLRHVSLCRADAFVYPVPLNVSSGYNPHKTVRDLSIISLLI
jgi:solute carrier family 25 protein 34/35